MKRSLLAFLSCCLLPAVCLARTPLPAINLHHTSWTARDGAPAMILSISQSRDGWLWLGGPTGLYRFDGMQFESFTPSNAALLTRNVSVVNAFADGALWIGYRTGGAGLLQNGRIRNYGERDGLPPRAVWGIEQDGDGRVWAATAAGMFYLENDRWQAPVLSWRLPEGWYKTLMRDRHGVLWAQGESGVYSLRPGAMRFAKAPVDSGIGVLFNLPDDSVVSWDAAHARFNQLAGTRQKAPPQWQRLGDPTSLLFDRRGDLWVGLKEGLEYRSAHGVSGSAPPQGLSGRSVGAIFEDREGNIWAATSTGIDRFRSGRLTRIEVPASAIGSAVMADEHGGAWIGGFHVSVTDGGHARAVPLWPVRSEGWSDLLTGFTRTSDGVLWGSSYAALRRVQGKDSRTIALPAALGGVIVTSVLADRDDSLLAALGYHGLYRRKLNGDWEKTGNSGEVSVMARSDAAGLWLGAFSGRVLHAGGAGAWRSYGPAEGLTTGLVMALHLRGPHVWAGGDNGLALLQRDRFAQLCGVNGENFDGISGIVELENGDLWLNGLTALFRIPAAEIARFKQDHGHRLQYERLDQRDGLEGSAPRVMPSPSLVLSSDGYLWVVRSTGVFRLRPAPAMPPAPAQPVIIKAIGAPGQGRPVPAELRFAAGSSALQIDYTVPALAMPEKVRFRYRLDGVDVQWQEVGARRSAYYSNLGAGDYHFRVAASDYNGQWSGQDSVLHFSIAPTLTERDWFRALCGLLLLAAAYLAYRWHIKRLRRQMAGRMQVRVSERERIARELHDTLLQSVQGLILHVHAAVVKLPPKDSTRAQLETALRQADEVVDEGRGRIRELRGEDDIDTLNFADAVQAAAGRLRPSHANPIRLKVSGTGRQLEPVMHKEALAIITEAVANAYCHAHAEYIDVELHYGALEFRCTIHDDGRGIPVEVVAEGGRQNHWGLRGMAERAERIKARLALRSEEGSGTEWQLSLSAALAYTR